MDPFANGSLPSLHYNETHTHTQALTEISNPETQRVIERQLGMITRAKVTFIHKPRRKVNSISEGKKGLFLLFASTKRRRSPKTVVARCKNHLHQLNGTRSTDREIIEGYIIEQGRRKGRGKRGKGPYSHQRPRSHLLK